MRILGRCLFVALLLTLGVAAPAQATFPGDNGRISHWRYFPEEDTLAIFTVRPDGFGSRQITASDQGYFSAFSDWSPDAKRLAIDSDRTTPGAPQVWTIDPDGSRAQQLTDSPNGAYDPAWSPDGRTLAFEGTFEPQSGIYLMPARPRHTPVTAAQARRVTRVKDGGFDSEPQFSPDGQWIVFTRFSVECTVPPDDTPPPCQTRIFRVRSDGRHLQQLTDVRLNASAPDFHPSGRAIAFDTGDIEVLPNVGDIRVMRPDGSDKRVILRAGPNDYFQNPSFSPDGRQVTFARWPAAAEVPESRIWVARADGGGRHAIPSSQDGDNKPDWGSRGRGHHGW